MKVPTASGNDSESASGDSKPSPTRPAADSSAADGDDDADDPYPTIEDDGVIGNSPIQFVRIFHPLKTLESRTHWFHSGITQRAIAQILIKKWVILTQP